MQATKVVLSEAARAPALRAPPQAKQRSYLYLHPIADQHVAQKHEALIGSACQGDRACAGLDLRLVHSGLLSIPSHPLSALDKKAANTQLSLRHAGSGAARTHTTSRAVTEAAPALFGSCAAYNNERQCDPLQAAGKCLS